MDFDPYLIADPMTNILKLNVQGDPVYMQPGETVVIDMDALNLAQHVVACQAMLNFSSEYFMAGEDIVIDGTDPTMDSITPADDSCIGGTHNHVHIDVKLKISKRIVISEVKYKYLTAAARPCNSRRSRWMEFHR